MRSSMLGGRPQYHLAPPWAIGSNLEPSVTLADGSEIGVWHDPEHQGVDGRITYDYEVRDQSYWTITQGQIHSGVGDNPDLDKALSSLLSFASANAEHVESVERTGYDPDPLDSGDVALGRWYSEHESELMQYQYPHPVAEEFEAVGIDAENARWLAASGRTAEDIPGILATQSAYATVANDQPELDQPEFNHTGEDLTDAEVRAAATTTVSLEGAMTMDPDGTLRPLTEQETADFTAAVRASDPAVSDTFFVAEDGYDEPTLWRQSSNPEEEPQAMLRRSDMQNPTTDWPTIEDMAAQYRPAAPAPTSTAVRYMGAQRNAELQHSQSLAR